MKTFLMVLATLNGLGLLIRPETFAGSKAFGVFVLAIVAGLAALRFALRRKAR